MYNNILCFETQINFKWPLLIYHVVFKQYVFINHDDSHNFIKNEMIFSL